MLFVLFPFISFGKHFGGGYWLRGGLLQDYIVILFAERVNWRCAALPTPDARKTVKDRSVEQYNPITT